MRDEKSVKRQLHRERTFCPPYCPRPTCINHKKSSNQFWNREGSKPLKRFPYLSIRFRCKDCKKTFSASFFKLHYRQKIWGHNSQIFQYQRLGTTMRETARILNKDESFVRGRLKKMARWGFLIHAQLVNDIQIEEPIVYDGLENFSFSQFDPNNLNHAVGKHSLFTYDFNLCPINRKGLMSPWQARKKSRLDEIHGAYPKNAIQTSTATILSRLQKKAKKLTVFSDKHFQYRRAIASTPELKNIEHITISSKAHRNFRNPLFAVNHIDNEARQNLSAFKRETIAFSKHSIAMQESYVLSMIHRNYMRPKFWPKQWKKRKEPVASPAQEIGATRKILTFDEFFSRRVLITQVDICEEWKNLFHRIDFLSRRPIEMVKS